MSIMSSGVGQPPSERGEDEDGMESCAKRPLLPLQPGGEHDPRELVKSPDMGFLTMERKT